MTPEVAVGYQLTRRTFLVENRPGYGFFFSLLTANKKRVPCTLETEKEFT